MEVSGLGVSSPSLHQDGVGPTEPCSWRIHTHRDCPGWAETNELLSGGAPGGPVYGRQAGVGCGMWNAPPHPAPLLGVAMVAMHGGAEPGPGLEESP